MFFFLSCLTSRERERGESVVARCVVCQGRGYAGSGGGEQRRRRNCRKTRRRRERTPDTVHYSQAWCISVAIELGHCSAAAAVVYMIVLAAAFRFSQFSRYFFLLSGRRSTKSRSLSVYDRVFATLSCV